MDGAVQKICCVCRRDVRQRKRTKDSRGNYYCNPCYEARLVAIRRELGQSQATVATGNSEPPKIAEPISFPSAPTGVGSTARPFWLMPLVASVLVGLTLDHSNAVRIGAGLGLVGCILLAVVGIRSKRILQINWRDYGASVLTLGLLLAGAAGAAWLGFSRAGVWGGTWMAGGVVLTVALWLRRDPTSAPIAQPVTLIAAPAPEPVAPEPVEAAVIENATVPSEVVEVQRRVPRRGGSRREVRISDLLGAEAQAEVEAAKSDPAPDPDVPVSPATNSPVTALVEDFTGLLMPQPAPVTSHIDLDHLDDPFESTPFRMSS